MSKKNILFVGYGGGHATMLVPLVRYFLEQGKEVYQTHVLGLTIAAQTFSSHGIESFGFRRFLREQDSAARAKGEELASEMHAEHTGLSYEESVAYLGLSYQELVEEHGKDEAERRFKKQGRQCFLPVRTMQRIFDELQPDIVVTTNSPRAEQAAREVAIARGIPVFALTDLLGNYLIYPLRADHLFIACEPAMKKYREADNVDAAHYHLTGNPAMDAVLTGENSDDSDWLTNEFPALNGECKYIVSAEQYNHIRKSDGVFLHWTDDEKRQNLDRLYRVARENKAVLLVRPHPSLEPEVYIEWVEKQEKGTAYMAAHAPLYRLLRAVDLLISNNSTIMLDALYLETPVLLVEYPDSMSYLPFDQYGYVFTAPLVAHEELSRTVKLALESDETHSRLQKKFKSEFPALPCTPRIVSIIENAIAGH